MTIVRILRQRLRSLKLAIGRRQQLHENYEYDRRRFLCHADPYRDLGSRRSLGAYILMLAHGLEKGFALPRTRSPFGLDKVDCLLDALANYVDRYGVDRVASIGLGTLKHYFRCFEIDEDRIQPFLIRFENLCIRLDSNQFERAGVSLVKRESITASSVIDFGAFVKSRHSIRCFSDRKVEASIIRQAVEIAMGSPSVCNRQSGRVHAYYRREEIDRILAYQNGNRGFGDQVPCLLVVTSELGCFLSIAERNQPWVDGGLFAMTLVYAIHSLGLGACFLNWSAEKEQDLGIRSVSDVPASESVVVLIAVGNLPDTVKFCESPTRGVDAILREYGDGKS